MNAPEIAHTEATNPLSDNQVPRVVSYSRRLTLGYEFPDASLAGPSSVELWGSTDQGRNWTYWGNDQDCQSPCRVEVDRPGEYHFRIVRLYRAEDQALRPGAGDSADIIVVIPPEKKPVPAVRLKPIDG